jgi:hypothetical protein
MTKDLTNMLTTGQVARELGISVQRVQQLYGAGKLRIAFHTPRGPLFDPKDIEAEKQRRASA